ncbi:hypothetical protein M8C21_015809, partial [Ambrosia artemisiifolia]
WLKYGQEKETCLELYFKAKVKIRCRIEVATEIRVRLRPGSARSELFRGTCFGPWLDVRSTSIDSKLVHLLLQTECTPVMHQDALFFHVGGQELRFGPQEFCLITGMRFGPQDETQPWMQGRPDMTFRRRVFGNVQASLKVADLKNVFYSSLDQLGDVDAVRLCLLMLVEVGFMGCQSSSVVDSALLELVDDLDSWNTFPWGSYVWKVLYVQLHNALAKRSAQRALLPLNYSLEGFVWAFKIWIFEVFPYARNFAIKHGGIPRAISWGKNKCITWKLALPFVMDATVPGFEPLVVLTPTPAECTTDWWRSSCSFFDGYANDSSPLLKKACLLSPDQPWFMVHDQLAEHIADTTTVPLDDIADNTTVPVDDIADTTIMSVEDITGTITTPSSDNITNHQSTWCMENIEMTMLENKLPKPLVRTCLTSLDTHVDELYCANLKIRYHIAVATEIRDRDVYKKLHNVLAKRSTQRRYIPLDYSLSGFIWAFKIWIFEAFPYARNFATKHGGIPRAISWGKNKCINWKSALPFVMDATVPGLEPIPMLTPTPAECATDWWQASCQFFDSCANDSSPLLKKARLSSPSQPSIMACDQLAEDSADITTMPVDDIADTTTMSLDDIAGTTTMPSSDNATSQQTAGLKANLEKTMELWKARQPHCVKTEMPTTSDLLGSSDHVEECVVAGKLSSQSDIICVQGYEVKQSVAPILESIFNKHGDIAADCIYKPASMRSSFLEIICEVVSRIQTNDDIDKMEGIEQQVLVAEAANINVSWLQVHLDAIRKRKEASRRCSLLMEMKENTGLVKNAALMDLRESCMELMAAQERFEKAERCVRVLNLVEKNLNDNILESKVASVLLFKDWLSRSPVETQIELFRANQIGSNMAKRKKRGPYKRNIKELRWAIMKIRCHIAIVTEIRDRLRPGSARSKLFKGTCFGPWLDVQCTSNDSSLVHLILQTEYTPKPVVHQDALFFRVGGRELRFGPQEFCLITGMRFGPYHLERRRADTTFRERVFGHLQSKPKIADLKHIFDHFLDRLSDLDAVRICLLMLVEVGFMGCDPRVLVDKILLELVEDLDSWNKFPWGSFVWKVVHKQLHNALAKRSAGCRYIPVGFTLKGFIWVFKIWIFEVFPYAKNFAIKHGGIPRAISWGKNNLITRKGGLPFVTDATVVCSVVY